MSRRDSAWLPMSWVLAPAAAALVWFFGAPAGGWGELGAGPSKRAELALAAGTVLLGSIIARVNGASWARSLAAGLLALAGAVVVILAVALVALGITPQN